MKLFPPYKNYKIEIHNPDKFRQYLEESIEYNNTNHSASLEGTLGKDYFFVQRKLFNSNTFRPQIKGVIKTSTDGKQTLIMSIESKKHLLYLVITIASILVFTAIIRSKPLVLIGIPITMLWFYILGFIFHNIELTKTKAELDSIMETASSK